MAELNPKLLATIIAVAKKEAGSQAKDLTALEKQVEEKLLEFHKRAPILETPDFFMHDGCLICKWQSGLILNLGNVIGPQGPQGIQGIQGPQGPKGEKGERGEDGLDGKDGADGKDGLDGKDGRDGKDGKDGKHGIQGPRGPKGPVGLRGESGKDGKSGKDGRDGKDGKDGVEGPPGTGIEKVWVDDKYHLTFRLTSGKTVDAGYVRGPRGNSGGKGGRVTGGTYSGSGGYSPYVTGVTINQDGKVEITLSNGNTVISDVPVPSSSLSWIEYVTGTSQEPTLNTTLASGPVYDYVYGSTTIYRHIPDANPYGDTFYTDFDGTTLSGVIVSRSTSI